MAWWYLGCTNDFFWSTIAAGTIKDQNNNDDDIKDVGASKALDTPLLGFFVGLTGCNPTLDCVTPGECILTNTNSSNPKTLMGCMCYIYFSGSPAAWRPILLALSGRFVSISDLRRKILMAGRNQTKYSTYAATRTSIISLLSMDLFTNMQGSDHCDFLRKHNNQQNVYKGKHLTSYIGVVTDMFIRGRLLELDGCIWLLLIHQPLSQVHGLRVGATVRSIKHFFYNWCLLLCILCKDVLGWLEMSCSKAWVFLIKIFLSNLVRSLLVPFEDMWKRCAMHIVMVVMKGH
mgnify:FL=1